MTTLDQANKLFEKFRTEHPDKPFIFDILDDSNLICIVDKDYLEKINSGFKHYFQLQGDRYVCIRAPPVPQPNPFFHFQQATRR